MLSRLSERERSILVCRFGLAHGEPVTLKELGAELGIPKEHSRQLEVRALSKLRKAVHEKQFDLPD